MENEVKIGADVAGGNISGEEIFPKIFVGLDWFEFVEVGRVTESALPCVDGEDRRSAAKGISGLPADVFTILGLINAAGVNIGAKIQFRIS